MNRIFLIFSLVFASLVGNAAPVIQSLTANPDPLLEGKLFLVSVEATDDVTDGYVLLDARPALATILRLPLTKAADRWEAQGTLPEILGELEELPVSLRAFVFDTSRARATRAAPLTVTRPPVEATFTFEASAKLTNQSSIGVSGAAPGSEKVRVIGGTSIVEIPVTEGRYVGSISLHLNKVNNLFASAVAPDASESAPLPAKVTHDAEAPSLHIDFPPAAAELTNDSIVVAGRVGDMLSGFMGLEVTVNGSPANVAIGIGNNGTFERGAVPLQMGENVITAVASDEIGNQMSREIRVTRVALEGPRMEALSGDQQSAPIHTRLAQPLVVKVTTENGTPLASKLVTFDVIRSDGRLAAAQDDPAPGTDTLQVRTDADGLAKAWWTLGADAGCGNNRLAVTSKDIAGTVFFCATATPGPAAQINIGTGNNQRVQTGAVAPEPLRAWVSDSCNGIAGVQVTFTVISGGGKVNGQSSVTLPTSPTGHAEVTYTAGPVAGNQVVEANFPNNPTGPASFVTFGLVSDPNVPTRFSGLVLDNASKPIGGAHCVLHIEGHPDLETFSTASGAFEFNDIPAGPGSLHVDGLVATRLNGETIPQGSFPALHYMIVVVPNAANSLPAPVLLPRLNPANARTYDGTQDVVLTCEGMEGLKMTIKAGSMRRADGSIPTTANPAVVALNQVHHDDVPMPMPDGAAPPFAWTLQPGGATFNPPITIEYPNMSALPPGAIAYFLSYNHDTERFEIVSSGHVTDDGSTIVTDPGSGLSLAGWGCNCPPYSVTGECEDEDEDCEPEDIIRYKASLTTVALGFSALPPLLPVLGGSYSGQHLLHFLDGTGTANFYGDGSLPVRDIINNSAFQSIQNDITSRLGNIAAANGDGILPPSSGTHGGICFYDGGFPSNQLAAGVGCLSRGFAYNISSVTIGNGRFSGSISYQMSDRYDFDPSDCSKSGFDAMACQLQECDEAAGFENFFNFSVPFDLPLPVANKLQGEAGFLTLEQTVAFQLPQHRPIPVLGPNLHEEWHLQINGQVVSPNSNGSFQIRNISAPDQFGEDGPGSRPDFLGDDFNRVVGYTNHSGKTLYVFSEFFQVGPNQSFQVTDLTFTENPPQRPERLRILIDNPTLTSIGQTTQLHVTGRLDDGTELDVTPRSKWTVYRTSNPAVATVGPDGLVTAVGRGIAFLTAVNEGATAVTRVLVEFNQEALTTLEGFVFDENGSPAAGAEVVLVGQSVTVTTDASGRFTIPGVLADRGSLVIRASFGTGFVEGSGITPVPGGFTDTGILTVLPDPPPTLTINSPQDGDALVERQTIDFFVLAEDNGSVNSVKLETNTGFSQTLSTRPFLAPFTVPVGMSEIRFTATATDNLGGVTTRQVVASVTPDLLTTLRGTVLRADGTPAADATVTILQLGFSTMTATDGTFQIPNIPTVGGAFSIRATLSGFAATISNIQPVSGGVVELGQITLGDRTPGFYPFGNQIILSDDAQTSIGAMPFAFEFFGQALAGNMTLNANGVVALNNSSVGSSFDNYALPPGTNNIVAPFFDDIDPGVGGLIGVYDTPGVRAITWELVPYFGRTETVTFQVAFLADNSIEFRYADMALPPGGTADSGISVGTATIGLSSPTAIAVPSIGSIFDRPALGISGASGIVNADGMAALDELPGNDILVFSPDGSGNYVITFNGAPTTPRPVAARLASVSLIDEDNDGLTTAQEEELGCDARLADSDGDGISDGLEHAAGTDPDSGKSCLVVTELDVNSSPGGCWLEWISEVGRRYTVQTSEDCRSWAPADGAMDIPGQEGTTKCFLPTTRERFKFFRVMVREDGTK